jgi:nucleoid-associated protein YgaU
VVQASDTLLLLCEEIYGSPAYYLKVAMVNKLDNFRQLVPGQELFFPPIKK